MSATTLVSRVARVQTAVAVVALALVAVGTMLVVDAILVWKTDRHLHAVMGRAANYLGATKPEDLDWRWFAEEVEEVRPPDVRIEVDDPSGRTRIAAGEGHSPVARAGACTSRGSVRGCTITHERFVLRAAQDRAGDRELEWQIALALAGACFGVGVGVALLSRAVTRNAVQPFSELAARVEAVEPGTGERAAFCSNLTELDALASRFDDLVQRFEAALAREKRFSAEASHELRTPLTVARGELEELLARGDPDPETVRRAIASIDRLSSLVDALLWFARAQGRMDGEELDIVNVADLVRGEMTATERVHAVQVTDGRIPDEALVRGDEELLRRAVANLFENAVKHGNGKPIGVRIDRDHDQLRLFIANGGQPIPRDVQDHLFEPFFRYRREAHAAPGFGLGLPFTRAVARSHGGELTLSSADAGWIEMALDLPLVDWHDAREPSG